MNDMELANVLSIAIPYFFVVLGVLVPVATIWVVARYIKKRKKNTHKRGGS